jgi:hypothetical protein
MRRYVAYIDSIEDELLESVRGRPGGHGVWSTTPSGGGAPSTIASGYLVMDGVQPHLLNVSAKGAVC